MPRVSREDWQGRKVEPRPTATRGRWSMCRTPGRVPAERAGLDGVVQESAGLLARLREHTTHAGGARDEPKAPRQVVFLAVWFG
jgi:hypothetical protein